MKTSKIYSLLFTAPLPLLFAGCVSVNIGGAKPSKDLDTHFKPPAKPFVEVSSNDQDKAWRNEKNGNTISYLSECNEESDPPLEQIEDGIVSEIDHARSILNDHVTFNSREAIHAILDGEVDGIPTRFELMVLKKSNCILVLTYAAVLKDFGSNQKDFNNFVKGFVVP